MRTPLPAARPSALTTTGKLNVFIAATHSSTCSFVKLAYFAVGISLRIKNSFVKRLLPSNSAHILFGPKALRPASFKRSTIPITNGTSGPTIVKSIFSFFANATKPSISLALIATFVKASSVPPFPGATKIFASL